MHFSLAASFFTDVRMVGPVGDDFGEEEYAVLHGRGVDTEDIEHVEGGKTFFWAGEYEYDFNTAKTLDTQLNVFGDFQPKLSEGSTTPSSCSSPTSSPTCSARCASSAPAPRSPDSTR